MNPLKSHRFIRIIPVLFVLSTPALSDASLLEGLKRDIEDHHLDDFTGIQAAFLLSGVSTQDSLDRCLNWYHSILQTIRNFQFDSFDRIGSAKSVFHYLHSTWLRQYSKESTTLLDVLQCRRYNCVSATVLYNFLCEDLGWSTDAFETPSHVYTIFTNFTQSVMVENTSPMGFDIIRNLQNYSRFLLQFYPENQALKIGLDRIYAYENGRGRTMSNTELLGLLAYNRAYLAEKAEDFESAYQLVLFAQKFNSDSRSNVEFEIRLFYQWGGALFQAAKYQEAFEVYCRGMSRYPDVGEFQSNARSSFFNGLVSSWNQKNWDASQQIIRTLPSADFFKEKDFQEIDSFLQSWIVFLSQTGRSGEAKEAERLRSDFSEKNNQSR